ncbi:DUF3152 domain-containing protein [Streptomyces sp. NPDC052000]|uniref:DUF3152 domain-containing protein n=1 Tax=Streptomyces sp. NPDC052000 TaxID=3155676 RepID=UPI00344DB9D1
MGRHSRPKGSTGPVPMAEAPPAPRSEQNPEGGGRRRRQAPGDDSNAQHQGGTPAFGTPQVRGGHPQHHEGGGGWGGAVQHEAPAHGPGPVRQSPRVAVPRIPGPRREYTEAFDDPKVTDTGARRAVTETAPRTPAEEDPAAAEPATKGGKGSKGRTFTGIAAAAVTTVLAVVVAGQVASGGQDHDVAGKSAVGSDRDAQGDAASRGNGRATPSVEPAAATYEQKMAQQFPLDAKLAASGNFEAVPGFEAAPGKGRKYRYRVDIEQGLGLDGGLFAEAVQKTLNDDRSWAHSGAMTFERISSGKPDFVITLASPGTTGKWCAKSGLDTNEDNVSCDSAATDRVMINAYRWAQGSVTFGAQAMHAYRQMLINHEVGHRLGHNHVSCRTPGTLAPVMQQQTKSLDIDGIKCLPNAWVYPQG